jgi:septum site-determining protein MinD
MTHIIALIGAKGGVGRTTTAINLTAALDEFGRQVVLIDCHLHKPNVGLYLGFDEPTRSIHSAISKKNTLLQSVHQHDSGLLIIPGSLKGHDVNVSHKEIAELFAEIQSKAELIIVDTPGNNSRETQTILSACNYAIAVTAPDRVSVVDAAASVRFCKSLGKKVIGVVVCQTSRHEHNMRLAEIQTTIGVPVIGLIPFDSAIQLSHTLHKPVITTEPQSKAAEAFKKLAANLIGEPYVAQKPLSLFTYLRKRIGLEDAEDTDNI